MSVKVSISSLVLICFFLLTGCGSQSQDLAKENSNLKTEIESMKQQVAVADEKVKQQDELYELRNSLDANLYFTISALIKGDYELAKKNLASTMRIQEKRLLSSTSYGDNEFIIPDTPMNLRERAYMMNDNSSIYTAIYEIYDAGYSSGNKYDERIYTLNVNYIQENGQWKMSNLMIDE